MDPRHGFGKERGRGRQARLPRVVGGYRVVKRKEAEDGPIWLPVGTITIFEDGRGLLNLNFLDGRFNLFPKEE
jgi:hypothetical protein